MVVEAALGLALFAYSLREIHSEPSWWAYVPVYLLASILTIIQMPRNSTWRTLSSLTIVFGGLYTTFLLWTFSSVGTTPTIDLQVARNLPPLAFGTLLICYVRLTKDKLSQPVHYLRSSIILFFAVISLYSFVSYIHYVV